MPRRQRLRKRKRSLLLVRIEADRSHSARSAAVTSRISSSSAFNVIVFAGAASTTSMLSLPVNVAFPISGAILSE